MMRKTVIRFITSILFIFSFLIGLSIAAHKPLWVDELHTHYYSFQHASTAHILLKGATDEGNNAPLYYITTKWIKLFPEVTLTSSRLSDGIWADPAAQLVIRINAIIFVSAALAMLFYFISLRYSICLAIYAFFVALSSPMIWLYWAEARPYPLLLLLTFGQIFILISILEKSGGSDYRWKQLALLNVLLVLTSYLALIQVIAATAVLLMGRKYSLRKALLIIFVPIILAINYRFLGVKMNYGMQWEWSYFANNIPWERCVLILIAIGLIVLSRKAASFDHRQLADGAFRGTGAFLLSLLMGICILLIFLGINRNTSQAALHSRYFIFLTPAGIMLQVLAVRSAWLCLRSDRFNRLLFVVVALVFSALAIINTGLLVFKELKYL